MHYKGALIVPTDIVLAIAGSNQRQGWLGGSSLDSENVFVAAEAIIGTETVTSKQLLKLTAHRSWQTPIGTVETKLLEWRKVRRDFFEKFSAYSPLNTNDLAADLSFEVSTLAGIQKPVCIIEESDKGPRTRGYLIKTTSTESRLFPLDMILLPEKPDPYSRIPTQLTEPLRPKHVVIVGVGSGGGEIALNLGCAGVGQLRLFDSDRLHPENYIRHVLTGRDLGRSKVAGMAQSMDERDLTTRVVTRQWDVLWWANEFRDELSEHRPDLVVCATDSRASRRFANFCCIKNKIPLVIAGILDAGRIGEAMLVEPYRTACYECIRAELGATLAAPATEERPTTPYEGGEEVDLIAGVQRLDIGFVSSIATRLALQVLDPSHYEPLPMSYIVWGRERSYSYGDPFRFDMPMTVNYVPVMRRPDCPVCGELPGDLEGVDVERAYAEIMKSVDVI